MNTLVITMGTTDYEFYNVSDELAKAILLILHECENDECDIVSAESERFMKNDSNRCGNA